MEEGIWLNGEVKSSRNISIFWQQEAGEAMWTEV